MNIYEKLAKIQKDLFVPKGQTNDFGHYNYRSCEDILKSVKPLCEANKTVLILNAYTDNKGNDMYVTAEARLQDLESSDYVTSTASAREEATKKGMDGSQISGASLSYARKYALAGLFCIDNEKDSDATNKGDNDNEAPMYIAKNHIITLRKEMERTNTPEKNILYTYKIKSLEDMTIEQFTDAMKRFPK